MKTRATIKALSALAVSGLMLGAGSQSVQAQQSSAAAQPRTTVLRGQLSRPGEVFLLEAARTDLEEVQAGRLAQKQSSDPAVRSFAEHMVNDHSKVETGLKEIAAQKGATVPTQLTPGQDSALRNLESLSGAKFDRAYAKDMVKGHEHAVKKFQWAAKNIDDPDLRAWAQTTLPLLQEHLRMAKNMQAAVKGERHPA